MKIKDIIKKGTFTLTSEQVGIPNETADRISQSINDSFVAWSRRVNKLLREQDGNLKERGMGDINDTRLKKELTLMCHPYDFISNEMGDVEFNNEKELTYFLTTFFMRFNHAFQQLPEALQDVIQKITQVNALGATLGKDIQMNVVPARVLEKDLELTDKGVFVYRPNAVRVCGNSNEMDFEGQDVVVFEMEDLIPRNIAHIVNQSIQKDELQCGHLHANDESLLFVRVDKISKFRVFSLCAQEGEYVTIRKGVMVIMPLEDLKKMIPNFVFDETKQVMIKNYTGEIVTANQCVEGDMNLMITPVKESE